MKKEDIADEENRIRDRDDYDDEYSKKSEKFLYVEGNSSFKGVY